MADEVLLDRDGPIAVVTLNRPEVHNALNAAVLGELSAAVRELDDAPEVRAVVLTGAGSRSFCAGADIDELAGLDALSAREVLRAGQRAVTEVAGSRTPVVAAVNGLALGGGFELVLAAAFPVLSENASFALPESGLGLIPGYGGTQRLPAAIGRATASHLMLTGTKMSAERAFQLGLTPLAPVAPDALLDKAIEQARIITARGPAATAAILDALRTTAPRPEHLDFEAALAGTVTSGAEAAEGIAAFRAKRAPLFAPRPNRNGSL
ncbi:enoyl-CoA hydratase/isomerase family protein [Amycolatopsis orientalis]|uniref:enoyl-CoA hydratase/isomerase family protein n=1 Tax=Amycolatopsis orientalis TaxID=31958 RepID=UPI00039A5A6E|nr:enoyl-CoA hydratase/isomerase family protein [Amycolatopsis orientalis]